jgi:hypothetical protein
MISIPFWLREPLRRFVQYVGVFLASIPAGMAYVLLLSAVSNTPALIMTLPLGLLCAYFAWVSIGKHFLTDTVGPTQFRVFSNVSTSTQYAIERQDIVLVGSLAVVVLATCIATTQVPATSLSPVDNSGDTGLL